MISFEDIDSLSIYLENLDSDDKTIATNNIEDLIFSGAIYDLTSDLEFFIRNTFITNANVIFDGFIATTPIRLINLQDVDTGNSRNVLRFTETLKQLFYCSHCQKFSL